MQLSAKDMRNFTTRNVPQKLKLGIVTIRRHNIGIILHDDLQVLAIPDRVKWEGNRESAEELRGDLFLRLLSFTALSELDLGIRLPERFSCGFWRSPLSETLVKLKVPLLARGDVTLANSVISYIRLEELELFQ